MKSNRNLEWEENWQAKAGAWFAGERVIMHGKNILECMQGKSWMDIMLFGITGKMPTAETSRFLDEVLVFSGCIPDPRLWNNRIAALAGTARTNSTMAIAAATAVSDAVIYGFQPTVGAFVLFKEIQQQQSLGISLDEVLKARLATRKDPGRGNPAKGKMRQIDCLPGYGRPVAKGDERIPPLMEILKKYNVEKGESIVLAYHVQEKLHALGYKLKLNMGGLIAAICLDQQLGEREFLHYLTACFCPGLMACYDDALSRPEGSFFPMRCEQIDYKGESERQWKCD